MNKLLQWAISSTAFKKSASIVGGFALGVWFQAAYWQQIRATLDAWGVSRETWHSTLWVIIGASGVALSVGLSAAKSKQTKSAVAVAQERVNANVEAGKTP